MRLLFKYILTIELTLKYYVNEFIVFLYVLILMRTYCVLLIILTPPVKQF